jgi:hypothetical protein
MAGLGQLDCEGPPNSRAIASSPVPWACEGAQATGASRCSIARWSALIGIETEGEGESFVSRG